MIDVVTRYTTAVFIKSKKKEVIVDMIIQLWMSILSCKCFLIDKSGELMTMKCGNLEISLESI